MAIKVRAKARGFYQGSLVEKGATFTVASEQELGAWMERLDEPAAKEPTKEPAKVKGAGKEPDKKEGGESAKGEAPKA